MNRWRVMSMMKDVTRVGCWSIVSTVMVVPVMTGGPRGCVTGLSTWAPARTGRARPFAMTKERPSADRTKSSVSSMMRVSVFSCPPGSDGGRVGQELDHGVFAIGGPVPALAAGGDSRTGNDGAAVSGRDDGCTCGDGPEIGRAHV